MKSKIFAHLVKFKWVYGPIFKTGMVITTLISFGYIILAFHEMWILASQRPLRISEERIANMFNDTISWKIHSVLQIYYDMDRPPLMQKISGAFLSYLSETKFDSMVISPEGGLEIGVDFEDIAKFINSDKLKIIETGYGKEIADNIMNDITENLAQNDVKIMQKDEFVKNYPMYKQRMRDDIIRNIHFDHYKPAKFPIYENAKTVMTSRYTWYFIGSIAIFGTCVTLCCMDFPPHVPNFPKFPK